MSGRKTAVIFAILNGVFAYATSLPAQTDPVGVPWALANGQATVTHSVLDIGSIANVFDGDTGTLARTMAENPMVVTLNFASPKELARSRVWFLAGKNNWRVETAESVADLDAGTGTFRVALDWATGAESAWQDRTFAAPITCRVVRLKLQRIGEPGVHLCEWQLFSADRPFAITEMQAGGEDCRLTWNSSPNRWYEIQASTDLTNWTSAGFQKGADMATGFTASAPQGDRAFFRVRKALPEERASITRRVLVVNLDPVLEAHGNVRLHEYLGWFDPHASNADYLADLTAASGGKVQWELAAWVDLDLWPVKADGFQYTDTTYLQSWADPVQYPWHKDDLVNYETLLDMPLAALGNKTAHQMAASGEVDEVVFWGFPYAGFYESRMVGSTAYWCNSGGIVRPSRLYVVMGLNYERPESYALHSFGHRAESIMKRVYGSWSSDATINHLWDRFTRIGPQKMPDVTVAGCGNVHFPPNAANDYEYSLTSPVTSEADIWLGYPDLAENATTSVSASSWGGPDYQRGYLVWWMSRFPKAAGRYTDPANATNNGKLNNWWGYIADMNEYAESR